MRIQSMNSSSQLYKGFFNFTVMHHHRQKNGLFTREKEEGKKKGFFLPFNGPLLSSLAFYQFPFFDRIELMEENGHMEPATMLEPAFFSLQQKEFYTLIFSKWVHQKKKIIIKNERMMKTKKDTIVMYSGKVPLWLLNGWIVRCSIRLFHLDNNTISDS